MSTAVRRYRHAAPLGVIPKPGAVQPGEGSGVGGRPATARKVLRYAQDDAIVVTAASG
ncbi:MAG: hypothetical protein LAN83_05555 [Acidobacteriia bacterium]|nr:hypothetical protein [Terriglobia bacterium]